MGEVGVSAQPVAIEYGAGDADGLPSLFTRSLAYGLHCPCVPTAGDGKPGLGKLLSQSSCLFVGAAARRGLRDAKNHDRFQGHRARLGE